MAVLRSLAFYVLFYGGSVIFVLVAMLALVFNRAWVAHVGRSWSGFHRLCVRYLLGIRITIRGKLPTGQVFVAYKHESFFEAIDVITLIRDPAVFAKAELLRIPLWGRAGAAVGLIPVERDQGASALRKMIAEAKRYVAQGRPLVIFPEGSRVQHGTRPALQPGFAGLYKLLSLPVVPVAINSGPLYHRRWKRSGVMTIAIGETIPPGLPRDEIEARVIAAINALN